MAYANGQFPTSATVALATAPGQRLVAAAAANWDALALAVQGRHGWLPYLTDSYRPYSVQERIFRERYRVLWSGSGPYGDVRYWQGVRWVRVTGAAAAVPGTSNHGWGKAVDCSGLGGFGGTRFRQLAALAPSYGFTNTEGRSVGEAWHWVFTGSGLVSNPIGGGGTVSNPNTPGAPAPIEEDTLYDNDPGLQARLSQIVQFVADNFNGLTAKTDADRKVLAAAIEASEADVRAYVDKRINDLAGWTRDDAKATRDALGNLTAAGTDPAAIAAAIAPLLPKGSDPKAVADELANRLKG